MKSLAMLRLLKKSLEELKNIPEGDFCLTMQKKNAPISTNSPPANSFLKFFSYFILKILQKSPYNL